MVIVYKLGWETKGRTLPVCEKRKLEDAIDYVTQKPVQDDTYYIISEKNLHEDYVPGEMECVVQLPLIPGLTNPIYFYL